MYKTNKMTYTIIKESTMWSTNSLKKRVEEILNEKTKDGYEVVTVAFGLNMWWMPTAFITLRK
jgi:hypothetical protein